MEPPTTTVESPRSLFDIFKDDPILRFLIESPIDSETGLKVLKDSDYASIRSQFFIPKPIEGYVFRLMPSSLYNPYRRTEFGPYCGNNESFWGLYYQDSVKKGRPIPRIETDIYDIEFIQEQYGGKIETMRKLDRRNVLLKDPMNGLWGERTGYSMGCVTTPLIIAKSESNELLILESFNGAFMRDMHQVFPTTCVEVIRESNLSEDMKKNLNTLLI